MFLPIREAGGEGNRPKDGGGVGDVAAMNRRTLYRSRLSTPPPCSAFGSAWAPSPRLRRWEELKPAGRLADAVGAGLDLEGAVNDAEAVLDPVRAVGEEGVAGKAAGHDEMGGERNFGGAHRPDVEVVDALDAGQV